MSALGWCPFSLTPMSSLKGTSVWPTRTSVVDVLGRPCCVSSASALPMSAALDYVCTCPPTLHVVREPKTAGSEFPLQTQKSCRTAHLDLCPCFLLPCPIRTDHAAPCTVFHRGCVTQASHMLPFCVENCCRRWRFTVELLLPYILI
jgi:hypothetical protein